MWVKPKCLEIRQRGDDKEVWEWAKEHMGHERGKESGMGLQRRNGMVRWERWGRRPSKALCLKIAKCSLPCGLKIQKCKREKNVPLGSREWVIFLSRDGYSGGLPKGHHSLSFVDPVLCSQRPRPVLCAGKQCLQESGKFLVGDPGYWRDYSFLFYFPGGGGWGTRDLGLKGKPGMGKAIED